MRIQAVDAHDDWAQADGEDGCREICANDAEFLQEQAYDHEEHGEREHREHH